MACTQAECAQSDASAQYCDLMQGLLGEVGGGERVDGREGLVQGVGANMVAKVVMGLEEEADVLLMTCERLHQEVRGCVCMCACVCVFRCQCCRRCSRSLFKTIYIYIHVYIHTHTHM